MRPSANPDSRALAEADPTFAYVVVYDDGSRRIIGLHSASLESVRRFAATAAAQGRFPAIYVRLGNRWRKIN